MIATVHILFFFLLSVLIVGLFYIRKIKKNEKAFLSKFDEFATKLEAMKKCKIRVFSYYNYFLLQKHILFNTKAYSTTVYLYEYCNKIELPTVKLISEFIIKDDEIRLNMKRDVNPSIPITNIGCITDNISNMEPVFFESLENFSYYDNNIYYSLKQNDIKSLLFINFYGEENDKPLGNLTLTFKENVKLTIELINELKDYANETAKHIHKFRRSE